MTTTIYAAFEATVIAAACGWTLWHTATRVLKLKLGRRAGRRPRLQADAGAAVADAVLVPVARLLPVPHPVRR